MKSEAKSAPRDQLADLLAQWAAECREQIAAELEFLRKHGGTEIQVRNQREMQESILAQELRELTPLLPELINDHRHRSAAELEAIADRLSPGSIHRAGRLGYLAWKLLAGADPLLVAALIYRNWHGGKVGFQFLPDPAVTDFFEYEAEAADLCGLISQATDGAPSRLLVGDDLAFFESLPERLTVYRGASGVEPEVAAAGVCWSAKRNIADWFAARLSGPAPVVLSAVVSKSDIVLAKAVEFEVVVMPGRWRQLKAPMARSKPKTMVWTP